MYKSNISMNMMKKANKKLLQPGFKFSRKMKL